MKPIYSL